MKGAARLSLTGVTPVTDAAGGLRTGGDGRRDAGGEDIGPVRTLEVVPSAQLGQI